MQFNTTEQETIVNDQPKEKKENFFAESKKLVEQYIQDKLLLIKLQASKTAATTAGSVVNGVLLALFGLFALIFVSITLAFVFSKLTGSFIWGFAIVSAIYIALVIVCIVGKKWMSSKIANAVIKSIYSKKKVEKEDDYVSKN